MTRKCHLCRYIHWPYLLAFLLFKVIGLAPFSVQRNHSTRRSLETRCAFVGTKLAILHNSILFCMAVSIFATIPSRYYSDYTNKNMITTMVETVLAIWATSMICIVLLCYCKNQSTLVRIGNHLIHVETELRRLRESIGRKQTLCLLLVLYLFHLGLVVVVLVTYHLAFQSSPLLWLTDIMPVTFATWILIQYFSVLIFVNATFADVNGSIQSLCRSCSYCNRSMTFYQHRRVVVTSSSIQLLLRFRDIHDHLCSISDDISEFYSLPVLAGVSYIFFDFLYNVYYLLIPIVVDNTVLDSMVLGNTILWLFLLVYPLSLLTMKITNIAKEVGASRHDTAGARERQAYMRIFTFLFADRKDKGFRACVVKLRDRRRNESRAEAIFASVAPSKDQIHRERIFCSRQHASPNDARRGGNVCDNSYSISNGFHDSGHLPLQLHARVIVEAHPSIVLRLL